LASAGRGSISHAAGVLFKSLAEIDIEHVARRSGTHALADLLAEQVQLIVFILPDLMEYIKAGKLRALAVTTPSRLQALPDVPSLGEFLPGCEAAGWQGICAPKNTPAPILNRLNSEINAALVESSIKSQLSNLYATTLVGSPSDLSMLIEREKEKWSKLVKPTQR
jgi:tripartite-type tricarboxylate transporter receptor subunit TctC